MSRTSSFVILLSTVLVLAALFWHLIPSQEQNVYEMVFLESIEGDTTNIIAVSRPSTCNIQSKPDGIQIELFESFKNANDHTEPVRLISLEPFIPTIDAGELEPFESTGLSTHMLVRDNRPILHISRVGFSADGSEGMFCVHRADQNYANNSYFVVKKVNGNWVLDSFKFVSVS
jgi:hypothetical protein